MKPITIKFDDENCSIDELFELQDICRSFNLNNNNVFSDTKLDLLEIEKIILFGFEINLSNQLHDIYEKNNETWIFRIENDNNVKKIYIGNHLIAIKIDGLFNTDIIKNTIFENLIIFVIDNYPGEILPHFDCHFNDFHMVIQNCHNINGVSLRYAVSK